jgi:hypothetical protein
MPGSPSRAGLAFGQEVLRHVEIVDSRAQVVTVPPDKAKLRSGGTEISKRTPFLLIGNGFSRARSY